MEDLRCNSLKCRKSLSLEGSAVVTTCSHIFCVECANALFSTPQICPACETSLPDSDDVVQTVLNPPDAYKTSVLSGLAPTMILDIASRAMNFYTYQIQQESAFQALVTKNAQERIAVLEAQCATIMREATSEITLLKERVGNAERDLEFERRKVRDLHETHKANAKAYNKLKAQYDKAKQRALLLPGDQTLANAFQQAAPAAPRQSLAAGPPAGTPLRASSTASLGAQNRVNLGWTSHLQGGPGGGAGVPLAQNPGNSSTRPRRPLLEQNQNTRGPASGEAGFGGGGAGFFGAGGGIAPMPRKRSGGSNGSSRSDGGASGGNGQGQQHQQQMPEYLGQQGGGQKRATASGFRPAAFANS